MDGTGNDRGYGFVSNGFSTGPSTLPISNTINTSPLPGVDYNGPTPTDGSASSGIVSMGQQSNRWQTVVARAIKFADGDDDLAGPGMLLFGLNAPGQQLAGNASTMLTLPMLNNLLDLSSVIEEQKRLSGVDASAGFAPERVRMLVQNPTNGDSFASAVMEKYSVLGRRGHNTIVDTSRAGKNVVTFNMEVIGNVTLLNQFGVRPKTGDEISVVVKPVIVKTDGISTPNDTLMTVLAKERQIVQAVPMCTGPFGPMGQEVSNDNYLDMKSRGTFLDMQNLGEMSRDGVEFGKTIVTKSVTKTYDAQKRMVVTTEEADSEKVAHMNMYTIGECIRVAKVWEGPPRAATSDSLLRARRSHNALAMLPTMRVIFVGDHV